MRPPQYISVRVRSKSAVRIGAISVVAAATGGLVAGRAVDILIGVIIGLIIALIVIILNKSDAEQAPPSRHNALTAIASFVIACFFCRATESTDGSSVRKDASAKEDYNFRSAPEPTTKLQRSSRQQQSLHESTSGANTSARIEEAATKREDLSRRVCDGFSVRAVPNDNATFAVALLEIRASYSSGSTTVNAAEAMRVFCVYGHRHSCKMLNMDAPEKRPSPACLTTRDDPAKEPLFLQILRRSFVDYSLSEKTTDDWNTMVTFDEIFEVVIYYIDKDQPSVAMSGFQVGSLLRRNGFIMGDLVSITASCEEELSLDLGSENRHPSATSQQNSAKLDGTLRISARDLN